MKLKNLTIAALISVLAVSAALAQFGGRPGDVVIYALTSKGRMDFQVVSPVTTNDSQTAAKFEILDSGMIQPIPFGAGFPPGLFVTQNLHQEPDDTFRLLTMREESPVGGPHRIYLETIKSFIVSGFIRDTEANFDFPPVSYGPLVRGIDFGPDIALGDVKILVWSANFKDPLVRPVPLGVTGPIVPPGMTGLQYALSVAKTPAFIAWSSVRNLYPGVGWPSGVDLKFIDEDQPLNTTRFLRLRRGRRTPWFRITGATHLFVLEGSVEITPAGSATPITLRPNHYAFVPKSFVFRLSNPRKYEGPSAP